MLQRHADTEPAPEVKRVFVAIAAVQAQVTWLAFRLGNYVNSPPSKAGIELLRQDAKDCAAAGRDIITAAEGVVNLTKTMQKEEREAASAAPEGDDASG